MAFRCETDTGKSPGREGYKQCMSRYCKVLVIDDEFITRQGIKHMILWEQEGFQIVGEASNGQEGLEMIEKHQPDIVLADIVMPVLDGIDFSMILQERYPDIKLIILSSYDNFEYVRTTLLNGAVDYVLKPTLNPEILLRALKKAVRSIPGFRLERQDEGVSVKIRLERYLTGYQNEIEEEGLKQCFPYMHFRILAADMKKGCRNNRRQMDQLQELLQERFRRDGFEACQMLWLDQEILCCVLNYMKKQEAELLTAIQESTDIAGKIAENQLFVISSPFTELTQIREIYEEKVKPCLGQKFYFHDRNLISQDEYTPCEITRFHYEQYTEFLKKKQYCQALEFLRDYMKYLAEIRHDEYVTKNLLKNLLYNFLMEIERYGVDADSLRGEVFRSIDETDHIEKYRQCCSEIFARLMELAEKIESSSEDDVRIAEIREYINTHYNEKLDLTDIAREFSFNYHYISSYFNQHIPEGFSGYLNTVRIEKSCALLRETRMPISDISVSVGYSDHGYYCRMFRKLMGQTPSQYRHSIKDGGR